VQNLVHLVAGGYLARAARAGLTDRPFPWLLTAAGSALPLALPATGPVTIVLHGAVVMLALTVAATRHPSRSGPRSRAQLRDGA
jgi:hypothetical protein